MKVLDKVETSRDKAIDDLITRTKQVGAPGKNSGQIGWDAVYESIKREQEHERAAQKSPGKAKAKVIP